MPSGAETAEMRKAVMAVYKSSITWQHRVREMTPEQVTAIYLRFKKEEKL
jgi:hypothetical protein